MEGIDRVVRAAVEGWDITRWETDWRVDLEEGEALVTMGMDKAVAGEEVRLDWMFKTSPAGRAVAEVDRRVCPYVFVVSHTAKCQ